MYLTIATLGSYLDNGYTVTVHCNEFGCHHRSKLDLEALAKRYGRDYDMTGDNNPIRKALRCEKCGVKGNIGLTLHTPEGPVRGFGGGHGHA